MIIKIHLKTISHFSIHHDLLICFLGSSSSQDVHIVQTLTCSLGLSTYKTHHSMATVCKVSRSVIFPPQFKTLQEWFQYAFANSQIDGKTVSHNIINV